MDIEERLSKLENLVNVFITSQNKKSIYNEYDKAGIRQNDAVQNGDIRDNRTGIEESFEASLANSDDIADVRTALEEVYEMIMEE